MLKAFAIVCFVCLILCVSTCSAVTVTITGAARDLNGTPFVALQNGNVQVTIGTDGIGGTQNFSINPDGTFTLTILNVAANDRTADVVFTADGQLPASIVHLSLTNTNGLFVTLPEVKCRYCPYPPRRLFRRCR
jgi:hypothetical protein